jgi:hypothetical protein
VAGTHRGTTCLLAHSGRAPTTQGNRTSLIEDRGGVRDIGRLRRHGGAGL